MLGRESNDAPPSSIIPYRNDPEPPPKKRCTNNDSGVNQYTPTRELRMVLVKKTNNGDSPTPNRVTPSSAIPQVSAETLKNELVGKYHIISHSNVLNHRLSAPIVSSHNGIPTEKISIAANIDRGIHTSPKGKKQVVYPTPSIAYRAKDIDLPPKPVHPPLAKPLSEQLDIVYELKVLLGVRGTMYPPKFQFDTTRAAAQHNLNRLIENQFDLEGLLNDKMRPSVTHYGSEFKSTEHLQNLLQHHPRWGALKQMLEVGSKWKLETIEDNTRIEDAIAAVERGNHKSAGKYPEFLSQAMANEVKKGWELILPMSAITKVPGLVLSPMGVAEHLGIQEDGSFSMKKRVTHDLSFPGEASEHSINSRVIEDSLEPCMFGHALLRVVHRIVHLRRIHPNSKIWLRKDDAKSAYRRVHLNAETVLQSAVQIEFEKLKCILLALRLPFGGTPCPSEFCLLSDVIADVTNDLFACDHWDPCTMRSSYVAKIPGSIPLPDDIEYAQALETSVPNLEKDNCTADVFIDDVITVGVDKGVNVEKLMAGPCTVMHAIAHNAESKTFLPRQNFIAEDKNIAEGAPEEVKTILGWVLNTRELLIKLPQHKHKAWSAQLESFQSRKTANSKHLQSLLGRLEQIAIIIPMFGHFLNNIRTTEIHATASSRPQWINERTRKDLTLAQKFLNTAKYGVNLNLMTFRTPTHIYICDASEHGIGGFATHGRAWSWSIPRELRGRAHINLLEFLAQVVSIWLDILEDRVQPLDCLLGMGDNTASMGWLRRTNFRAKNESDLDWIAKQTTARKLANLVLDSETVLYRQWFRGADNTVADSLSRDAYFLSHESHQQFLSQTVPHQVPHNFRILPIPKEISSFISSTLQLLPVQPQRLHPQKPSELALGHVGLISSLASASSQSFWRDLANSNKTSSCPPLPKPQEKPPSLEEIKESWWRAQSVPPSHMWHRPSGQTTGRTPDWTWTVRHASSSRSNSGATGIKTAPGTSKKLCP